jgi:hypothetical protein
MPRAEQISEILNVAGVHGNREEHEPGLPLVRPLVERSLVTHSGRLEGVIANPVAVALCLRGLEANLALCLGDQKAYQGTHEAGLVPNLLWTAENRDLVVDWHGQGFTSQDYACVGGKVLASTLGFAAKAKISRVFVTETGLESHFPHAILMDIANDSFRRSSAYCLDLLINVLDEGLPIPNVTDFEFFAQYCLSAAEAKILYKDAEYGPGQEIPGAQAVLGIDRPITPVHTFGGSEVIAPVSPSEITMVDGLWQLPTFSMLAAT